MRGVLIDPFTRTVKDVETDGKLDSIYALLGVDMITVVQTDKNHALILDDEGLLKPRDAQEYFLWFQSEQPFAGKGLILGTTEDGDNTDATIPVKVVENTITFLNKNFVNPEDYLGWTILTE